MRIPGWQAVVNYELKIPLHDRHQTFMDKCWCAEESGASGLYGGRNNPLGCTQKMPGSWPLQGNTAGVQNYASRRSGIEAHLATLAASEYAGIVGELRKSAPDFAKVCSLIGASRWGTNAADLLQLCKQYGLVKI